MREKHVVEQDKKSNKRATSESAAARQASRRGAEEGRVGLGEGGGWKSEKKEHACARTLKRWWSCWKNAERKSRETKGGQRESGR